MAMLLLIPLFLSSILLFPISSATTFSPQPGICYGQLGDNLPPPRESVSLITSVHAKRVKLYDANPSILHALQDTRLQVSIMVPNDLILNISTNQTLSDQWVSDNVVPYHPRTLIRYLLVGNEVTSTTAATATWPHLVPAMRRIKRSLKSHGIRKIKVGTSSAMDVLQTSFPPSNGAFRKDLTAPVMKPMLKFLNRTKSFFFLDVYPFFTWSADPLNINLDYALFESKTVTVKDPVSGLVYTNLFDQMVDAVYFAMKRLGFPGVRIFIAETGWPNGGDLDQIGANTYNAATYNRNFIKKVTKKPRVGTPARPGSALPSFLFALFNENQKPGEQQHWMELTYLYIQYDEFDNAATTVMNHSPEAWDHMQFKDIIVKVASVELYYKAVHFYLQEHPDILNDLLNVLALRVDHTRVVDIMRKAGHIRLVKPYLIAVQSNNVSAVNEALNEIYVEEEDYDRLHESIDLHDNFDQIGLAQKIEKHELLEMRRVAAYIYKKAGRWKQSIALSKKDNLYKDCMETCSQSGDRELSEDLLVYFIEQGKKECFASCLFVCYDIIRPDVALELAWMNNMIDFAFPYLLQFIREYTGKVDELIKDKIEAQKEEKAKEKEEKDVIAQQNMYAQLLPLALPAPPMPGMGGGGYAPLTTPPMGGMGMPPMPPFGMPPMGGSSGSY